MSIRKILEELVFVCAHPVLAVKSTLFNIHIKMNRESVQENINQIQSQIHRLKLLQRHKNDDKLTSLIVSLEGTVRVLTEGMERNFPLDSKRHF